MSGRAGMISTFRATMQQSGASVRSALADRSAFWLQAGGMVVNNGFWLVMWFLFFSSFRQVGGWGITDVARLILDFGSLGAWPRSRPANRQLPPSSDTPKQVRRPSRRRRTQLPLSPKPTSRLATGQFSILAMGEVAGTWSS